MLFSNPSCGDTSRSVSTFSARLTSGTACSIDWLAAAARPVAVSAARRLSSAAAGATEPRLGHDVLVGDELGAVLLHHLAGEGAAADDEDLAVVLLEFLDERDEVAVAADDHEGVDVRVRERHLERVEREVDVGAVLVAAGRHHALHHADGVLRHGAAVIAGAFPVAVGDLGDDLAALLDRFEHGADIELEVEGGLDADLDVVEIDENGNLQFVYRTLLPDFVRTKFVERCGDQVGPGGQSCKPWGLQAVLI